jgi:hypothetical protein
MKRLLISLIIVMTASFMLAETVFVSPGYDNTATVLQSDDMSTVIEYRIASFTRQPVQIDGRTFYHIGLENKPIMLKEGDPELPYVTSSIIIPDQALTDLRIISADYTDLVMDIAPSKGLLFRNQIPGEIPYTFSETYDRDTFYPEVRAELGEPYILRDFRGQVVRFNPFQYNPVTGTLRVYHSLTVEINSIGTDTRNVLNRERDGYVREFESIYSNRFLNFAATRYTPLEEQGRMIVIAHDTFVDAIMPYVDWKNQKGIPTTIYPVSTIGNNATAIKNFIQSEYDLDDGLIFLQLVGDAAQIPTFTVGGGGSDPSYSLLAGNDAYGDIFVGRFSAENVAQVETQVERTIHYERDMNETDTWLSSGFGVASSEGAGIGHGGLSDIQHQNLIRGYLLDYTYTHVDQIYAPGATSAQVSNAVNAGRSYGNYTGHGSNTSWSTSGFSNTNVNALTNDYKLPYIVSVACVNGNFTGTTCFAEAWLRATNNTTGAPTGAIAMYASTVNQSWAPPMSGQLEVANLLVSEQKSTIGGLFFNGSFQMIDDYASQGPNEFKNWHIFGDASLQVRTATPEAIAANHMDETFIGLDYFEVSTDTPDLLVAITKDGEILASGYTGTDGNISLNFDEPPIEPMDLTLTITGHNKKTYITPISVIPSEGPYVVIHEINVLGSGDDNSVIYGDTATLNVRLRNVGIETALMVSATLMTDDPYITILDDNDFFGHITPGSNVLKIDAFTIEVADYVPDQHQASFSLHIEDNEENTWTGNFSFLINAPDYSTESVLLDDTTYGNGDGYLDPGETVVLTIPLSNLGHAASPNTSVHLVSGSSDITIDSDAFLELGVLYPNEIHEPAFTITAANDIEVGSIYTLGFVITGGEYECQVSFPLSVGPVIEDFETGDFTSHNWEFSGNQPWQIVQDDVYEGIYAARSGNITHSQSTTMSITIDVASAGEISFYRKVSSENNYDFLKFFINGDMVAQWSGSAAWSQVAYPVNPGNTTFTWTYSKDHIVSSGSDCAWIDFIEFPNSGDVQGGPVFLANPAHIDFSVVEILDLATENFWIRNFGDEEMSGTIEVYEGFTVEETVPGILNGIGRSETGRDLYNYTIPPQSNIRFLLHFEPIEVINYSGEIIITSNAENISETEINVVAYGFELLPPENLTSDLGDDHVILSWDAPDISFDYREKGTNGKLKVPAGKILRDFEILGYNIYRDDELLNVEPVEDEFYHDYDIEFHESYNYAVSVVYSLGESPHCETILVVTSTEEDVSAIPYATELRGNYPNPFNPSTTISFALQGEGRVQLDIYNILGQKVKTLLDDELDSGIHNVRWDGTNDRGGVAASGIYFYRMKTRDFDRTKKMILMK